MRHSFWLVLLLCVAAGVPAGGETENVLRRDAGSVTYGLPQTAPVPLTGSVTVSDAVVATTAYNALARLQLRDSSEIRIGDRTTVRIGDLAAAGDATPGATVYMERGAVRFAIQHPAGGRTNYRFITPTSTVGVRGTVGYFIVGPVGQQIYCVKCEPGDVTVTLAQKTVEVRTGQTLDVGIENGVVTRSAIIPNRTINNPAIDQFLNGVSPFGEPAKTSFDPTFSGSGLSKI